ncbi:hypothetical protein BH24ACT5_BH24ACT5_01370 [soil metagenome]
MSGSQVLNADAILPDVHEVDRARAMPTLRAPVLVNLVARGATIAGRRSAASSDRRVPPGHVCEPVRHLGTIEIHKPADHTI